MDAIVGGWVDRASQSSIVHVLLGFFAMGSWATIANRHHPLSEGLIAGAVQGTLTACFTLFLKTAIEAISKRLTGLAALWVPPSAAFVASSTIQSAVHIAAGTPEVAATVVVPVAVATIYAALYSYALWRKKERVYE